MSAEEGLAMVRTRAKRHRWHPKTLKSNDPLVVSAGWRRFQTQPVFALEDPNERQRWVRLEGRIDGYDSSCFVAVREKSGTFGWS